MYATQRWGRSRYAALLVVLTLHVALLTGVIILAKTRFPTMPATTPLQLLILPQKAALPVPSPPPLPNRAKKIAATQQAPPSEALTVVTPNTASDLAGPFVDWSQEARNVAAGIAKGAPAPNDATPALSSKSPFATPPAHHRGEQIPAANGQTMVFVTDDCYQLSKSITSVTNAINNGMGLQTYCNGRSKKPRGDLFDQLPAYRKLHPVYSQEIE